MVYIKKIFGRAGTGKTYTLTQEIGALLDEGVSIRDIAMVTHTRIGVHVFKGRMINELHLNSNDLIHFGTMHSLSWRRQGLRNEDIFGKLQEQDFLETYYPDLIKVPDEYPDEEFYLDSTDKARLSGRSKIKAMIEVDGTLSGCMIKDFDFERMHQMTGRTLGYTSYYVRDASRWSDKHDKRVLDWGRQYEDISPDDQEEFSTNFREYLVRNDLFSHARNLEEMYATKSYIPARYLFFDEFQDFSRLQFEIFLNWSAAQGVEQVTMAGDDAQCFVKGTLVDTPDGQVPIEDIHTGDRISTFAGGSIITDSVVTAVMNRYHFGELLVIKTKSGRSMEVTPEHHVFVHIPGKTDTDTKGDHYYIYLMYSSKYGYRIGTTNHLKRRLNIESGDSILGIKRCGTLDEVLYYETLLSLKYGIPKIVFSPRQDTKEQRLQAKMWTDKLFKTIPTVDNAKQLCNDMGIDINFPHAYSQAVVRGGAVRVVINVQLYATTRKGRKYPSNVLFIETSDTNTINKLESLGYKFTDAKVGKRLRITNYSVGTIMEECNKLYNILKCPVKIYSNISRHYPTDSEFSKQVRASLLIPASNILEGMYLSTFDGEKVFLDEVVSVEREWSIAEVYDLNVDKTHNYFADGFCVHNCIFRFSSASALHMINTPADEVAKLHRTFRHGKEILDNANALHGYMNVVEPVDVVPAKDMRGEIINCIGDEWKEVVDFTDPDESVLVLASTGEWVRQVKKDLRELFPDVVFVNLEDTRVVDRVFGMYNVLASLERGEEVQGASRGWDDKWESVSGLFKHSISLPRDMFYKTQQMVLGAIDTKPTMMSVLQGVKASIKRDEFPIRKFYTKETFEKDFLKVPWTGRYLINAIPDISIFPQAPDVFPAYAEPKVNKRIGTIHKAKGDEADTVLLFMAVSQPSLFYIHEPDVADDVLRQFYVGKTRPRTKLIEVYYYLQYSNGEIAPSPLEVIA